MNEKKKPTIWIVNEAGHPYHRALDLVPDGELRTLTIGKVDILRLDRLNYTLAEGIAKFASPDDYIIPSGNPIISTMTAVLWFLLFDQARFLQWNAKRRQYELSTVNRDDLKILLESFLLPKI